MTHRVKSYCTRGIRWLVGEFFFYSRESIHPKQGGSVLSIFFQLAAWLLATIIVILSLVPPSGRPTTGAPHNLEHFFIFFAVGVTFGLGYLMRLLFLAPALMAFAGAIEIAQLWGPAATRD